MVTTPKILKPEYTNFTLRGWDANESWTSLAGNRSLTESQARDYFWDKVKESVQDQLSRLRAEGWEVIDPIGPQAIKLRKSQQIDFSIDPSDIFLGIMTLGIALAIQLILNSPRRYVTYRPVEIRIQMARFKQYQ